MTELLSLIGYLWKYLPAFVALAKAIEAAIEEEKKQKFANDFAKGWQDGIETGDASALHALIDAHPQFKLRK